jgi:Flp pilus assembly protein TadG
MFSFLSRGCLLIFRYRVPNFPHSPLRALVQLRQTFQSLRKSTAAGAVIEFAVIIPVLVLLAIGVVDFGRAFFTGIAVASAARAGAQYGAQDVIATSADTAGMRVAAENDAHDIGTITVSTNRVCKCTNGASIACNGSCGGSYDKPEVFVTVKVTKAYSMILRYPGIPSTLTFRDSATFRAQ